MGGVEDLVGVSVPDAGEDAWIGEGSLKGAVFGGECGTKVVECGRKYVDAAGVDLLGGGFVGKEVERSTAFGARFGEDERALGEVERGKIVAAAEFCSEGTPVEAAGDHEVKNEPEVVVELDGDAFANAVQGADAMAFDVFDAWLDGAEEKGACYSEVGKGLAYDAWFKGGEVSRDVG